jgi:hypothetical protein
MLLSKERLLLKRNSTTEYTIPTKPQLPATSIVLSERTEKKLTREDAQVGLEGAKLLFSLFPLQIFPGWELRTMTLKRQYQIFRQPGFLKQKALSKHLIYILK